MSTIGDQVLARLDGIERRMALMERNGTGAEGRPVGIEQLQEEMAEIRTQMESINNQSGNPDGANRSQFNPNQNPKDWMPEILNQNYKELWRN